jgi:ABC-type polysaccharide/polyol phosphate export permease
MSILVFIFSTIYKVDFADFGIYLFSGLLAWNLISNSVLNGSASLINAEGYLKKVYVPKLIFPFVSVGVEGLNFLFSLISLSVIALFLGAKPSLGLLLLPFAFCLTILFVLGFILITSIVTVYFRDLLHILQIIFMGLFYFTPIVYKQDLFAGNHLLIIKSNPFYYFIELFHQIIYEARMPDKNLWFICTGMAVVSLMTGLYIFSLKEKDIVYRL